MRYLLTLAFLGIVISGCSPSHPNPPAAPTKDPDIASIAPEERNIDEATAEGTDSHLPVMTAKSPPIILTPIQGDAATPSAPNSLSTENWQTFTSSTLGVMLEYPSDWTVTEDTEAVTFTSPQGGMIQLKTDKATPGNNELKVGNRRCTSRTNPHDLIAEVCVETISFLYTANFSLPKADGSTQRVTLLTQTRTVGEVFDAMFNSVRAAS